MESGVRAVVFDNNGVPFFLIFHRPQTGWELMKGRVEQGETSQQALIRELEEKTRLSQYKVVKKLDIVQKQAEGEKVFSNEVFLVETSMNIPVTIPGRINTYLWTKAENAINKLQGTDKQLVEMAVNEIKALY